jgi:cytochrome c553
VRRCSRILVLVAVLSGFGVTRAQDEKPDQLPLDPQHAAKMAKGLEIFKEHVRPVLVGRCVKCHGGETTESELNLTTREGLLKGGAEGPAVVLGKAKESRLYKLTAHLEEPNMPEDGAKLPDTQIAHIATWIDLGAPYDRSLAAKEEDPLAWTSRTIDEERRKFWSFQPLKVAEPPAVKNTAWPRTPIDKFVLAKLEEKGLSPNSTANKRQLIRRAYFDLVGLPPSPDEVERFVNDNAADAYEKLTDRLLESPHHGERWARHWLDVARFAESHGFEQDYDRPYAYHFRDFVIKALNQDMPYDQFVKWQLAGDEFAPDDPLAMMATGFLGGGVFPTHITANEVERTRYDALDDMAATVGTGMLGLTIGCARCHDHKFDPIPQADYYRLTSTFTTTVRSEIELDLDPAPYRKAKAEFDAAHAPLTAALKKFETEELPARVARWEDSGAKELREAKWLIVEPAEIKSQGGSTLAKQQDGSILASGKNPDFDTFTFVVHTELKNITGIRLEALAHPSFAKSGPGRADNGNFALTNFTVTAAPKSGGEAKAVVLSNAKATFEQKGLPVAGAIDADPKSAWAVDPQFGKDHAAAFETPGDVGVEGGTILTFTLEFKNNNKHSIGRPRLSLSTAPLPLSLDGGAPQNLIKALDSPRDKRTPEQVAALSAYYRQLDPDWQALHKPVQEHLKSEPKPKLTKVMVCSEGFTPIRHHTQGADFFNETHFLKRGETNQKQGVAGQSFLQVLMQAPEKEKHWIISPPNGARTSHRRTSLANWMTDTEYGPGQLLARVIVNRLWQHHFGRGIVSTPNDFGFQGARPTQPELLDWLAADLVKNGWRLKRLHKLMMTSAAYMQSGEFRAEMAKLDPENVYLWRRSPARLEAEIIRDAMLAASGSVDPAMFGPGTLDEGHKRRSIYFMVKRSKLIPMMTLFDAPEPLVSVGGRPSTTIAPQALLFMNNPHVRGYAHNFAKKLAVPPDAPLADVVRRGYLAAVARVPTDDELKDNVAFLESQVASYVAEKKPNARELALADFCQVLMSLNEFVYVE